MFAQVSDIQESALRQIQSLIREKESRTPAQKKMDSQLLYGMKQDRGEAITPEVPTMELNINKHQQGRCRFVYPNPNTGQFQVRYYTSSPGIPLYLSIYDKT